jgi:hypothetical protein
MKDIYLLLHSSNIEWIFEGNYKISRTNKLCHFETCLFSDMMLLVISES